MKNRVIEAVQYYYMLDNGSSGIDMISGVYNVPLGHSSLLEKKAIIMAAGEPTCTYGNYFKPGRWFASTLNKLLDVNYSWTAYSNGAEIVERAVQMTVPPNGRLVAFEGAFHGKSFFSSKFHYETDYQWPIDVTIVPRDDLSKMPDKFDAVIFEPIQGWDGYRFSEGQMLNIKQRCNDVGAHLIADEIFCGLSRAGPRVVSGIANPDILLVGKGLAGGVPGTALGSLLPLFSPFGSSSTFSHNHFVENVTCNLLPNTLAAADEHVFRIEKIAKQWFPSARIYGSIIFINYRELGIDIKRFSKKYKYFLTDHDPWLKLVPCYTMPSSVLDQFFSLLHKEISR